MDFANLALRMAANRLKDGAMLAIHGEHGNIVGKPHGTQYMPCHHQGFFICQCQGFDPAQDGVAG